MKLEMYCVYDEKAQAFLRPFCMPNDGMAIRAIKNSALEEGHAFANNPEDYKLYNVGTFDEQTSVLVCHQPPVEILTISQCIEGYSVENLIQEKKVG